MEPLNIAVVSSVPTVKNGFGVQAHILCRGLGLGGHKVSMIGLNRVQEAMRYVWEFPDDRIVQAEGQQDFTEYGAKRLYRVYPHGIHGNAQNPQDVEMSTKGGHMLNLFLQQNKTDMIITLQDTQTVAWMNMF